MQQLLPLRLDRITTKMYLEPIGALQLESSRTQVGLLHLLSVLCVLRYRWRDMSRPL